MTVGQSRVNGSEPKMLFQWSTNFLNLISVTKHIPLSTCFQKASVLDTHLGIWSSKNVQPTVTPNYQHHMWALFLLTNPWEWSFVVISYFCSFTEMGNCSKYQCTEMETYDSSCRIMATGIWFITPHDMMS